MYVDWFVFIVAASNDDDSRVVKDFNSYSTRHLVPIIIDGFNVGYDSRLVQHAWNQSKSKIDGPCVNWHRLKSVVRFFKSIGSKDIKIVIPQFDLNRVGNSIEYWGKSFVKHIIDVFSANLQEDLVHYNANKDTIADDTFGSRETSERLCKELAEEDHLYFVPSKLDDDYFELELAFQNQGLVITKDAFNNIHGYQVPVHLNQTVKDSRTFRYSFSGDKRNNFELYHYAIVA